MRKIFSLVLLLSIAISVQASGARDDKPIQILTVGGQKFTNVVFEQVTDTHVFFQHAGGMSSVRLTDLDPKLQKQLSYDPVKGAVLLKEQEEANNRLASGSLSSRQTAAMAAMDSSTGTNSLKPARGTVTKDFLIGKNRKLTLSFPNRWLFDSQQTGDAASPGAELRFGPQSGTNFVVLVSVLSSNNSLAQAGPLRLMSLVAGDCAKRAVDNPVVRRFDGVQTSGYYLSIANKAYVTKDPKPGAYRFEMQGMVNMDDVCLAFAALYNYPDGGEENEALEMIKTARLSSVEDRR